MPVVSQGKRPRSSAGSPRTSPNLEGYRLRAAPRAGDRSAGQTLSEPAQALRPPIGGPHGVAQLLPPLRVSLQVAVFKLDAGPAGALGHEAHFDLACLRRICLDLPL